MPEWKGIAKYELDQEEEERIAKEILFRIKQKENKAKLPRDKRELYKQAEEDGNNESDRELRDYLRTRINAASPAMFESSIPVCKKCARPNRARIEPGPILHAVHDNLIYLYCHCLCLICRGEDLGKK